MGPAGDENVCKESKGLAGILVLKLFPEKRARHATRKVKCAVFYGSS